ncbi:hypothetical protein NA78x_006277 [Anatilimnocola sp. NA78]|uniref:hypothetical protein n=1 Tax=Anatilimnocola sp. NA78 TaxID=3415683 RepID=UPI003CE5273C
MASSQQADSSEALVGGSVCEGSRPYPPNLLPRNERPKCDKKVCRVATTAGVPAIYVDGHAMLVRGLNQIENFIGNASRALREAKRE